VPNIAVITVATIDGPSGMPAALRIAGLTATMYAIVTKVVTPASTSRRRLVPAAAKPKNAASRCSIDNAPCRCRPTARGRARQLS
jgi:hypothetical protein